MKSEVVMSVNVMWRKNITGTRCQRKVQKITEN